MTHQNLSLRMCWKLFWATLLSLHCIRGNNKTTVGRCCNRFSGQNGGKHSSWSLYFILLGIVYIVHLFFCLWLLCAHFSVFLFSATVIEIENMLQRGCSPRKFWSIVINARRPGSCCSIVLQFHKARLHVYKSP